MVYSFNDFEDGVFVSLNASLNYCCIIYTVLNTGVRSHLQQSKYPHTCHKVQCNLKRKMSSHS